MNVKCFFGGILNLILKLITTTDGAETLNTRLIRITMHYIVCDIILNPIWRTIPDVGIIIFHALLQ